MVFVFFFPVGFILRWHGLAGRWCSFFLVRTCRVWGQKALCWAVVTLCGVTARCVRVCGGNSLGRLLPQGKGEESLPPVPFLLVLCPGPHPGGHILLYFIEEDAKTQKDCRLPIPQIHICLLQLNMDSGSSQGANRLPGPCGWRSQASCIPYQDSSQTTCCPRSSF